MIEIPVGIMKGAIDLILKLIGMRSPINDHDVELYDKYKALFVTNGAAEFYARHDFLSSFAESYWSPLSLYVDTWHTVEHEFVYWRLRKKHAKVYKAAEALGMAMAKYTVPIGDGTRRSVLPDYVGKPIPEHIKQEAKEINALTPAFAEAHRAFVRLANRKLRQRTA